MALPTIQAFMDTDVHTLSPETDILDAIQVLLDRRITGAPVIHEDRVVGVLTEKDCLKLLAHGDDRGDQVRGTVADFMTTEVRAVRPDMNIYFVAGMFLNDQVRRFPVIEGDRLLGMITRFDILRAIQKFYPR